MLMQELLFTNNEYNLTLIQYNILSHIMRFETYETIGDC